MEITRASQFAIRTVIDLAVTGPTHTGDVAARRGIPPAQASKIVQRLVRGGIVRTTRGAGGGVRLAIPPEQVTLRRVIDAIEGPLAISRCIAYDDCPCVQPCPVRGALGRIQREIEKLLEGVSVADLLAGGRQDWRPTAAATDPTSTQGRESA